MLGNMLCWRLVYIKMYLIFHFICIHYTFYIGFGFELNIIFMIVYNNMITLINSMNNITIVLHYTYY